MPDLPRNKAIPQNIDGTFIIQFGYKFSNAPNFDGNRFIDAGIWAACAT